MIAPCRDNPPAPCGKLSQALRDLQDHSTDAGVLRLGRVETRHDWRQLEPWWNALLAVTPGATVFQSFEYQCAWWDHLGESDRLWIVVVLRLPEETPLAIAPFSIAQVRPSGLRMRRLSYAGIAPESDRPRLLAAPADQAFCSEQIADYLIDRAHAWDYISFAEQSLEHPSIVPLLRKLRSHGYLVRHPEGPACPVTAIAGSWSAYLATRSRNFRKTLKRKEAALVATGEPCGFENAAHRDATSAFERYLSVERASWKAGTTIAVARAPANLAFYRELTTRFAALGAVEFHFLTLGARTIAATFGLIWNRRYYSLHIAHDAEFDDYSPGVVLTAREIEDAFARRRYDTFDFLSGVLPNKGSWATATHPAVDLFIIRPNVHGRFFCWISFTLKPWAKRIAKRLGLMPAILRLKALLKRSELDPE